MCLLKLIFKKKHSNLAVYYWEFSVLVFETARAHNLHMLLDGDASGEKLSCLCWYSTPTNIMLDFMCRNVLYLFKEYNQNCIFDIWKIFPLKTALIFHVCAFINLFILATE